MPSIIAMAWFLGVRAGWLIVVMSALMWFLGQYHIWPDKDQFFVLWNVGIHLGTFGLLCTMALILRRKERALAEKSLELARSNQELEQFAYKAAHDMKAPLTNIFSFTEFLAEKHLRSDDQEAKECADGILRGVERMKAMIKALLEYARVMKKDQSSPVADLEKVTAITLENLHVAILEKNATITHAPLPTVAIDPVLAELLFQNLIGNAMKYCEQEPRIHIAAVRRGKEWIVSFHDNGIGIPEESLEKIFFDV
jgi:light-regulated signal transduction histidine kinase (bacteriophytochrome)